MTKTASAAALLHVAVQDLHAGKAMQVALLGVLIEAIRDDELKRVLTAEHARVAVQQARLAGLADMSDAPENLWMKGALDDAERDTRSHEPGKLLDIAVLGAVRKAKAAEIVSSETAIALATGAAPAMVEALQLNRAEEIATDQALRTRLLALTEADPGLF